MPRSAERVSLQAQCPARRPKPVGRMNFSRRPFFAAFHEMTTGSACHQQRAHFRCAPVIGR
eukprot:8281393-Pyramimonas_sp.AAC.1